MNASDAAPADPSLSREDRKLIATVILSVAVSGAALLGTSWLVFQQRQEAIRDAESRMGAVLVLNDGFAYAGGERRMGAEGSQLEDEPCAIFLVDPAGPTGPALERGLTWRDCDTMAIVLDASNEAQGGACVPESREAKVWQDFATLLRG